MTDRAALIEQIQALLDRRLEADEAAALKDRLRTDPEARRVYIEAVDLRATLRWNHARPQAPAPGIAPAPGTIPQATPLKPGDGIPGPPRPTDSPTPLPIYRKGHEPQPSRLRPLHFAITAIAAALLIACGIGVYIFVSSLPQSEFPDPASTAPLATLIENSGGGTLTTPGGFISEGRDYPRGEYTLSGGSAEFMLTNSVNVKLRGNTRIALRNNMNVALTRGSANFVVPTGAVGFTVHLPDDSRVRDLGTAFRVDVDDRQRVVLRVTQGKVEWIPADPDAQPVLVEAGTAIEIVEGAAQELTASASLIAYWKFDEGSKNTAADSSPNGHHANATVSVEWTDGKVGGATRRPAFRVTDSGDFRTTEPVSVSAWVKPGERIGWAVIAGIDSYGESDGDFYALKQDNAGRVQWSFGIKGREITSTETLADLSAAQEDGWVHLVGVYEPGKSSAFYVNGELVGSMAAPIVKPTGETPFGIGVYANRDDVVFDGAIDDVQVYSAAVSADQVRELYENPGESLDSRPHTDSQPPASDQHVVGTERQSDRDLSERENETS